MTIATLIALTVTSAIGPKWSDAPTTITTATAAPQKARERCPDHHAGLRFYRSRHRIWAQLRGSTNFRIGRDPGSCADARWLAITWRVRAREGREMYVRYLIRKKERERAAERRSLYEKWRCIHESEGAWDANTGNGYYGGLQMDMSFQSAYGPEFMRRWGTADRWPVWAQLVAAERAYQVRGFEPWPNTARECGLL